jgi:hypothetical protein
MAEAQKVKPIKSRLCRSFAKQRHLLDAPFPMMVL